MSNDLKYIINLIVGDWSLDGHNQTDTITIESNLGRSEIEDAFKAGSKLLDFNLTQKVCTDYEDDGISKVFIDRLRKFNIEVEFDKYYPGHLNIDSFVKLWLDIAQLGNPKFQYELAGLATINIGGYGLFS